MSTALPLVSVVIPCFNQSRYLGSSLGSVHAQDWRPIESIVVDDGSTDDTAATAKVLGATRVVRQQNMGLARARNAGLAAAHGEYIVFLDADDQLLPDAVSSGVETMEQHPGAACVARRCLLMDDAERPLPTTPPTLESTDLYRELLGTNFVWTPGAALFRRDAIAAIDGFPTDYPAAADYAVLLALARQGTMIVDRRDAVWYRKHDRNMSRDAMLMLRAVLGVLERERPLVPARLEGVFVAGQRRWREFYGEQLATDLRREWRTSRRLRPLLKGSWFLCRECPEKAATHFLRKLSRVLRRHPRSALNSTAATQADDRDTSPLEAAR
jgi:glycosyltransferase involved in cell wall biosynthesis